MVKIKSRKPGGGRKLKYGEPTVYVKFRCPVSLKVKFRKEVNKILKSYQDDAKPK